MRRPRNKIAGLPSDLRNVVIGMLIDGKTYAAIQAELAEQGVSEADMPGLNAFKAYMAGGEYRSEYQQWQELHRKARRRSFTASAVTDEDITDSARLLRNAALEKVAELVEQGVDANGEPIDLAAVLRAANDSQRLSLAQARLEWEREQAAKVDQVKANVTAALANPGGITDETRRQIEEDLNLL
jgi:hypothetical protein